MPWYDPSEPATEATAAANVYPKGIINPLAVVRRAGPLVSLDDIESPKKKRKQVNRVYSTLRRAYDYPASASKMNPNIYGSSRTTSIYPYVRV